ncbi:MAG: PHP domain-containing protein [Acidimicrobiales bacterium]
MIDLHTHSAASDGTDPPSVVVELAAAAGCSAVALTDHDTLVGVAAARDAAARLGLSLVAGCEVSCAFAGRSVHVLVYFVEPGDGPLQDELVRLRGDRVVRNRRLVGRLAELGLPVTYDEVIAEAGDEASVGRPHVAAVIVRKGLAESPADAFDRWLGHGRPAYVPKARLRPAEVAALAAASGGVAVLAHPLSLELAPPALEAAVAELVEGGLAGLEALYAGYPPADRRALASLAARHDLVATGGSDYHGTRKPGLSVGTGLGDLAVPDDVLDSLAARRPG